MLQTLAKLERGHIQDLADAKEFKDFEFPDKSSVGGDKLPHLQLQKAANEAGKKDHAADEHQKLWQVWSKHESRLDTHDVQLSHIAERLKRE